MKICNLGCIGADGLMVTLDEVVCLVGPNNSGKSTVLRAYEAAVGKQKLTEDELHDAGKNPATVELWVHIPEGAGNIDAKWKESKDDLLLVRSRWTWNSAGAFPTRETWDPVAGEYAAEGNAAGLDEVFSSRLPQPFRIGSLEDPKEEHEKLLRLVLEPVVKELEDLVGTPDSDLQKKIGDLRTAANKPLEPYKAKIAALATKMNKSYQRVFGSSKVSLDLSLGDLGIDLGGALTKSSSVKITEPNGEGHWKRQGTGSQRALFWSMLEIRSELKRIADTKEKLGKEIKELEKKLAADEKKLPTLKQEKAKAECQTRITETKLVLDAKRSEAAKEIVAPDGFLPGHMLLIDEPETALHPSAIRGARDHLYSLAEEAGWQVMLTTHHPAFVDPAKDHTTIVRLQRGGNDGSPKIYRSDSVSFSPDEKEQLKSLLAFDLDLAEMFFGGPVIVVEGDTEYACFNAIMDQELSVYPVDKRPLIVRARGKATIPLILRMLAHFKVDFAVLHDIDAPYSLSGETANPAYGVNPNIVTAVKDARSAGMKVAHRCSCPNFELNHGMTLPTKDKPLNAWREMGKTSKVKSTIQAVLDELRQLADSAGSVTDGAKYEAIISGWISQNKLKDACYFGVAKN